MVVEVDTIIGGVKGQIYTKREICKFCWFSKLLKIGISWLLTFLELYHIYWMTLDDDFILYSPILLPNYRLLRAIID